MGKGMGGLTDDIVLTPVEAAQAQALLRQALEKLSLTGTQVHQSYKGELTNMRGPGCSDGRAK